MSMIDPVALARFMLLEGASDLLEAFARIPEGPVRNSLIHHAQMLAGEYGGARTGAPDPLRLWETQVTGTLALPYAEVVEGAPEKPKPRTVEQEVIERRLAGEWPSDIAKELKLDRALVNTILNKARSSGIDFPTLVAQAKPEPEVKKPAAKKTPKPKPEPTIWPLDYELQSAFQQKITRFLAKNAGIGVEELIARERQIIQLFKNGWYPVQIEKEFGLAGHTVTSTRKRALDAGVVLPPLAKGGGARKAMGLPSGGAWAMQRHEEKAAEAQEHTEELSRAEALLDEPMGPPAPPPEPVQAAYGKPLDISSWRVGEEA